MVSIGLVIHTVHKHRRVILGWRRHDDFLGTSSNVFFTGFLSEKKTGGLDNYISAHFIPFQFSGIFDGSQADLFTVDDQGIAFNGNGAIKAAMHGVVAQHVSQVVGFKQVVNAYDLDVLEIFHGRAEHHAPNSTKPIDTNFNCHASLLVL